MSDDVKILLEKLLAQHNQVCIEALKSLGSSNKCIPCSLHDYTNMFMTNLKEILKEVSK